MSRRLQVYWGAAALGLLATVAASLPAESPSAVRAVVLGIAQDAGVPHIGCRQELCVKARQDRAFRQRVVALGLIDDTAGERFLIDATPDLASQLDSLNLGRVVADARRPVDGILLTHAHLGHYTGLMFLGREALGARSVPVYATPKLARFLRENGPWSQLVELGNIDLRELTPGRELALTPKLHVTPLSVPHRDELSDTVGFRVQGPSRSLLYIPDIDKWESWNRSIEKEVETVDLALLDASFESVSEIPGRSLEEIPHPLVSETTSRLTAFSARVLFIHLNHTNRLLWDEEALKRLESAGFRVASDGEQLGL